MTLSKFRVNYGSTPGTIKGFTLARRCEIDVSALPDGIQGFDVPLVFDGTSADCTEWTVMVNGRLSNRFKAVMTNGHLRLYRNALVYIVK